MNDQKNSIKEATMNDRPISIKNTVAKNVIKPITFYGEDDNTIIEFPFEFSQAVNLNVLLGTDERIDLKNTSINPSGDFVHDTIVRDMDLDNRYIAVQQVLNLIRSQTIYIITNSVYFNEFYEGKYLFPLLPGNIPMELFGNSSRSNQYISHLSDNIEMIIRSMYHTNLISSYNDKEDQMNELITIAGIKGGQIAQLIITHLTYILENDNLRILMSCKENTRSLEASYDNLKQVERDIIACKNSRFYMDLRNRLDDYIKGKITKEEVDSCICNHYRGVAYNLLNDVSMKILDLCINALVNGTCTFFYGIGDMVRYYSEENC